MDVEVEGTELSPEEFDQPGWMHAHKVLGRGKTTTKVAAGASTEASTTTKEAGASQTASQKNNVGKSEASHTAEQRRPRRRAPPPRMPANDYKIVVRPRDGLNLSVWSEAEVADSIRKTLRFPDATTITDVVQVNRAQNLVLVSTPDEGRAEAYSKLTELSLGGKLYKLSPYVTAPDDSAKGVLHGIPGYDTQADIISSLQNNTPRVLHARRLGTTNSVIIVFEGPMVPHYVRYRGTLMRCLLYKKKIEVCSICRAIGHRRDICPTPTVKRCQKCGQDNPLEEHECEPKCVVCGGPHMARSKDCRRRFTTPPIIRRRRLQQRLTQFTTQPTLDQGGPQVRPSRSREQKRQESDAGRSRSRSLSYPPLPTRQRSNSRPRSTQVSWASGPPKQAAVEDKKMQALEVRIAQLSEIILRQEKEISQLKLLQRNQEPKTQVLPNLTQPAAVQSDTHSPTPQAQSSQADNSPPPKRKAMEGDRTNNFEARLTQLEAKFDNFQTSLAQLVDTVQTFVQTTNTRLDSMPTQFAAVTCQGDSVQSFKASKTTKPYGRTSATPTPRPIQVPSQAALTCPIPSAQLYAPPHHGTTP